MDVIPSVKVFMRIGEVSYPRCVADVFTKDHLTITAIDTDDEMATFPPGQWSEAVMYDESGYPIAAFTSSVPVLRPITIQQLFAKEGVA